MDQSTASTSNQRNSTIQSQGKRRIFGEIEEIEDEVDREYSSFSNFRVVETMPSDHHYSTQTQNVWMKLVYGQAFREKMEQEWRFLEEHVPSSIFVRAYEQREDLMRAAFFGPPGSDYQYCLFFFDIFFPANYPDVPPMVHYLCYDYPIPDLNPNLRKEGRACYGLVRKTWSCINSREKPRPKQFNVLHILHAIQDLITNHSPGPSNLESENRGRRFFSACEMMMRVLRKPPKGFEFLVAGHFRRVSHRVLQKFKDNGYNDNIMINMFKRMFRVFEENGSYCKHHLDFLKSRNQYSSAAEVP